MATTARDIMQSQVITLAPNDPLSNVHRLFFEEEIHGAPVLDEAGLVLGILTSMDLLRAASDEHESAWRLSLEPVWPSSRSGSKACRICSVSKAGSS